MFFGPINTTVPTVEMVDSSGGYRGGRGPDSEVYGPFSKDLVPVLNTSAETSANDVTSGAAPDTDELYIANREWAEEQAQKQMDFQTSVNKIAMDFSSAEADKARAWEAEMANTAYQRAVGDLKAAGLNPILAYSQGGAAVPSVSAAQGVTSTGAMANMADTGYSDARLEYAKLKLALNTALGITKIFA